MALRRLICVCLLLTVALAAASPSPPPQAATIDARDDCYKTVAGVPRWCAREFIKAVFNGTGVGSVSNYCCGLLACVREWTCDQALSTVCPPPEPNRCPPVATRVDRHDD
jgi:hypothetical protein